MIVGDEAVDQSLAADLLETRIERRAHGEAAAIELVLAEEIDDVAAHFLGEEFRRGEPRAGLAHLHAERLGLGGLALFLGDEAVLDHAIDHPVAAGDGALRKAERIVVARRLGQRREIGAIGDRQLVQRLVPIGLRRCGHAIGAAAEINLVQIKLEDLLLGEGALDADGEDRLFQLALDGLVARQEEVLGDLLGDGRGAHHAAARLGARHVGDGGTQDALNVEAAMLVEILVLGRDEGFDHTVRHRVERHIDAPLAGELGDHVAVIRMDAGHDRRLVFGEHFVVGQVLRHLPQDEGSRRGDGHEDDHACRKHEAEEAQQETAALAAAPLLRRLNRSRNVHGLHPSRPQSVVARGEPSNPSQHYGDKTLPWPEFSVIFGGSKTRGNRRSEFNTACAQRAWQNRRRSPR